MIINIPCPVRQFCWTTLLLVMHNRNSSIPSHFPPPNSSGSHSYRFSSQRNGLLNKRPWCLADQRARHHHGRRAGVCHPAQHDREAAVRPGETRWPCRNNGALFGAASEKRHCVNGGAALGRCWFWSECSLSGSGRGGAVEQCVSVIVALVWMWVCRVKGQLSALCRRFVRLTWREETRAPPRAFSPLSPSKLEGRKFK